MSKEKLHLDTAPGSSILNLTSREYDAVPFKLNWLDNHFHIGLLLRCILLLFIPFFHREDMYAQDSIDLLQNSGLQFKKHEEDGIEPVNFAELLMTSGIVLFDNIKMLSFHRYSKFNPAEWKGFSKFVELSADCKCLKFH